MSAAFVTLLSTVVPQRLFLILIYGSSILDVERRSMVVVAAVVAGWGGDGGGCVGDNRQDSSGAGSKARQLVLHLKRGQAFTFSLRRRANFE